MGDSRAVRILLENGTCTGDALIRSGRPLLVEALRKRPLHKLNTLFRHVAAGIGPDPRKLAPLRGGLSPWQRAAVRGRLEGITFLPGGSDSAHSSSEPRNVAASLAVKPEEVIPRWHAWQCEIAGALVVQDAFSAAAASTADCRGRAPLHYAAASGNIKLIDLLLQKGATLKAQDEFGRSASHVAALFDQGEAFERLNSENSQVSELKDVDGRKAKDVMLERIVPNSSSKDAASQEGLAAAHGWRPQRQGAAELLGLRPTLPEDHRLWIVDCYSMNWEAALHKAIVLQRPALLRGAARKLPASELWTPSGLLERLGSTKLRSSAWWRWKPSSKSSAAPDREPSLRAFVDHMMVDGDTTAIESEPGAVPYAFDTPSAGVAREAVLNDVPLFSSEARHSIDVRHPQIAVGSAGTGAPAHNHFAALNALIVGCKRWQLLPPLNACWSISPPLLSKENSKIATACALEVEQRAGDLLYVPEFWGHSTLLLSDSVAVAYEFIHPRSLWSD
eukprot:TRINITY_DN30817_c0_g1_i2.p1 TRINITY_DN30817_c0_g1~~TRINITY_DN30817_c0_g1_i2.p1  ORF type:complete len:505 (+),score=95.82 TRINITY_DN30817_c0_g1_i2:159-1673(+)